jgi:hypothetical protein
MSAMKRMLEEVVALVHDGNRDKLEEALQGWDDCQKVAILMHAIELHPIISGPGDEA